MSQLIVNARRRSGTSPSSGGGGTIFTSCNFDTIPLGALTSGQALGTMQQDGALIQTVVSDATSTGGGRSLKFDWQDNGGEDQISRISFYGLPVGTRTLYARMRYKIAAGTSNVDVVKKTFRFRGWKNGTDPAPCGTFNIQNGHWLFAGDDYSQAPYNIPQNEGTLGSFGPDTFIDNWRTIETMVSYPGSGIQLAKMWVDGTEILTYAGDLTAPSGPAVPSDNPSLFYIKDMYFNDTYNDSLPRTEWIDDVVVSDSYIGLP